MSRRVPPSTSTGAHQLYYSMGFTRLPERETRIVDGYTQPLLAFSHEVLLCTAPTA